MTTVVFLVMVFNMRGTPPFVQVTSYDSKQICTDAGEAMRAQIDSVSFVCLERTLPASEGKPSS